MIGEQSWIVYARQEYLDLYASEDEFNEDLRHILSLKKLFFKYKKYDILCERLILNHIVVLGNVFGGNVTSNLLFFHISTEYHSVLKSFLLFLNYLPSKLSLKDVNISSIEIDKDVIERLEQV